MDRRAFFQFLTLPAGALFLGGCAAGDYRRLAEAAVKKDRSVLDRLAKEKAAYYAAHPDKFIGDAKAFKADFQKMLARFLGEAAKKWGEKPESSQPKKVVKYSQHYQSRSLIDLENGLVTVETVDEKAPEASLKKAIVTTLLSPEDPTKIDLFSDKEVELGETPFLHGQVLDNDGKAVRWEWRANKFADYLYAHVLKSRTTKVDGANKKVRYVEIPLVKGHLNARAGKYRTQVLTHAKRYNLDPALVYAIVETESSFNPYATSPIPAYGLMQVVPTSAGRDAWRELKKEDGIPTKDYLYHPGNNVEMGCAYLHILNTRYLKGVTDKRTREECMVAAYNTGSGNVLRTFDKERSKAYRIINSMTADAVYKKLRSSLPYEETRNYVYKVKTARGKYA